jgi:hypothetical protein
MFGKDKKEVMQDIYEAGGSELPFVGGYQRSSHNLPPSMNEIIQKIFELVFDFNDLANKEIPRAFPHTESVVHYDPRYKHSSAERLHAQPITVLKDANSAIKVCLKLKQLLTKARTILVDFFPTQLDHPNFRTEVKDKFQYNVQMIDSFIENIEKILYSKNVGILQRKGQNLSSTIDMEGLEKLRNHIIKIGYDKKTSNKDLVELVPSVLTMRNVQKNRSQMDMQQQRQDLHYNNSSNDKKILELSDRLLKSYEDE